jgi:hypothetical protein
MGAMIVRQIVNAFTNPHAEINRMARCPKIMTATAENGADD